MFPCKLTLCLISLCTHPPLLMHLFSPFSFHLHHYLVCLPDNDCFSPLTDAPFQNCMNNVCNIRELCICIIKGCGYHFKKSSDWKIYSFVSAAINIRIAYLGNPKKSKIVPFSPHLCVTVVRMATIVTLKLNPMEGVLNALQGAISFKWK